MTKKSIKTREEWLLKAVSELRPVFRKYKAIIPKKVMVSCGWPRGGKTEVIGQCFGKTWTSDGTTHIFISPTRGDAVDVLAILVHELVHAAVGTAEGHRGRFASVARGIGLEGKLTATEVTKKSPLYVVLARVAKSLGKYPHSKMTAAPKGGRTGGDYVWPRLASKTMSGYTFVMSPKLIAAYGLPRDSKGDEMVYVERGRGRK